VVAAQGIPILVDTNVLLRAIQQQNLLSPVARSALKGLHRRGFRLCVAPQNVREFWNVCTRPTDLNGLGMSPSGAERHTRLLEKYFTILPDSLASYSTWRALVIAHSVLGVKVHDAWLVATMKVHGVAQILTFNTGDFARYDGIVSVDPRSV
jgi:predicted nucleic acid-binding protein